MGLPLVAYFANLLVFGTAIGFAAAGLVLRYGLGAEGLAWAIIFVFAPLSAVYYPIATLSIWLQPVALALPSAHVLEGMRILVIDQVFRADHLIYAAGLNVIYLAIGMAVFLYAFRLARRHGLLLQMGE